MRCSVEPLGTLAHSKETLSVKIRASQSEDELNAFRVFVEQSRLRVVSDSIEKRDPPEPDILCRLDDGNHVAFELVEICHPKNAAFFGGVEGRAELIEKAYQSLPTEMKIRFDGRFVNTPLSFQFRPEASRNQISVRIPGILRELVDQSSTKHDDWRFSADSRKVLLSVQTRGRVDIPGRPSFNIASSFAHEDVVVQSVMPKLSKTYKTLHPIELVAYFVGLAWGLTSDWLKQLQDVLCSNGLGQFRRIWVLGWSGVEFTHPKDKTFRTEPL
jgi:hypothetical protein